MAISNDIEVFSENSIYNKYKNVNNDNRKLKVYFSVPEKGLNEDTGLLLFIAGFGGQATSNVYKKMRDKFADKYNLVTIQCDYFGYEFMQGTENVQIPHMDKDELSKIFSAEEISQIYKNGQVDFNTFLDLGSKYNISVEAKEDLSNEDIDNFNDMGMIQAVDNVVAVLSVMNILYDNNKEFNSKKIIVYGHSHGAYLSYLCNAFAPKLFSLIIDNSAWLYPVYLIDRNRMLVIKRGNLTLTIIFEYLAKKIIYDYEIFNLPYLYSKFENNCNIVSYHGTTDNLISCKDKSIFCNSINKCIYNEICEDKVDGVVFKSTNHGLDSNFIELFDYTMNNYNIEFEKDTFIDLQSEVVLQTSKHKYSIDYKNIMPEIHIL